MLASDWLMLLRAESIWNRAFALASFLGFAYESCFLFTFHIRQKVTLISWKYPSTWEESILFWILLHHSRFHIKTLKGKKTYLVRFRLNKSFLHISDMPGKWFIRWKFFIEVHLSTETEQSVQYTVQWSLSFISLNWNKYSMDLKIRIFPCERDWFLCLVRVW